MSEMPISDAREHLGEVVGRARYSGEEAILIHYGAPAAVVISFEEYQRLKHARNDGGGITSCPLRLRPRSARAASILSAASPGPAEPPARADGLSRARPAALAGLRRAGKDWRTHAPGCHR